MIFDKFDHLKVIFGFGHLIQEERKNGRFVVLLHWSLGEGGPKSKFQNSDNTLLFFFED